MMTRKAAFTLLEILVALALLALIFGVATGRFHSLFARTRLQASGQGIADHFAYAVNRAYTTGKYHTIVFDLEAGSYWIKLGREDEEAAEILRRKLARGVQFTDIQVGHDTYESPGSLSVEISSLGVTNDVVINLEDEKEASFSLWLNALVQGVDYFDEHKTYEELQEAPAF
jgi:prepilin-type N-terminal cleavage/methylation domain-containing protein